MVYGCEDVVKNNKNNKHANNRRHDKKTRGDEMSEIVEIKTDEDGTPMIVLEKPSHTILDIRNMPLDTWTSWIYNPKTGRFEIDEDSETEE